MSCSSLPLLDCRIRLKVLDNMFTDMNLFMPCLCFHFDLPSVRREWKSYHGGSGSEILLALKASNPRIQFSQEFMTVYPIVL